MLSQYLKFMSRNAVVTSLILYQDNSNFMLL
jgi:hypothetical protein